jgi:hypothetical protein
MKKTLTKDDLIGTVSHGTLRPQDLILAFSDALDAIDPDATSKIRADGWVPESAMNDDADAWWNTEEPLYIMDALCLALDESAPEGCYFGTTEGDGADFGFWECEED